MERILQLIIPEDRITSYRRDDIDLYSSFTILFPNLTALENVELALQINGSVGCDRVLEEVAVGGRKNNFPA